MNTGKEIFFPNNEQFNYKKFPFYWIARLESIYTQEMEKTLKTMGMDASRWRVGLLLREHDQLTISEIANHAFKKVPTITKIVQRMEKEGLVVVSKQESDGRVRLVNLTQQGRSYVDDIVTKTAPMFESIFSNLTVEEFGVFATLSEKLFNNIHQLES